MRLFFIIIFLLNLQVLRSQNTNQINVKIFPLIDNNTINFIKSDNDSIAITKLKFYLTNFSLVKSKKTVWQENNSYHLVDISKPKSLSFIFNLPKNIDFDEIHFLLGTDSLTNVSGVMGGDLDPTKGMYWAWNSGYINFKLEGKNNSIPFEFHLGGYAPPHQTAQKIKLKTINKNSLNINLNITDFLTQLNLTKPHKIMSPGKDAQQLSILLASLFHIK